MSTDIHKLVAQMEVRQARFEREMRRAAQTTNRRAREIENRFKQMNTSATAQLTSLGRSAVSFASGFMGGFLGAAGVHRLVRGVRGAVSELSELGKTSRDVSMDVEDLQGLMRGFERETRVSGDQLASAFERFNRRVGEAARGVGPLQTSLDAYNINVRHGNGQLKTQAELLREVADVMRRLPSDQQRAALAQAAFGDVGRQMVGGFMEGAAGLERMVAEARAAGDVIERDLIQRAELLDDKFDALTRRAANFFKTLAIGAVGQAVETPLDVLERMFGTLERARDALGDDLVEALTAELGVIDQLAPSVERAAVSYEAMNAAMRATREALDEFAASLFDVGDVDAGRAVLAIADDLVEAQIALQSGEMSALDFRQALDAAYGSALDLVGEVTSLDAATLSGILAQFRSLFAAIRQNVTAARELRAEAGAPVDTPTARRAGEIADDTSRRAAREALAAFLAEEERLASRTREQIALEAERAAVRRRAAEEGIALTAQQVEAQAALNLSLRAYAGSAGSDGGGSGAGGAGQFAQAVEAIRERTAALEAEATALIAAASAGRSHGDAIQYAYQRARLMHAAQRDGLEVTPELEAAIDRLAESYARAGDAAAEAASRMRSAQEESRRGIEAMTGLFRGIMSGAGGAEQALVSLLMRIAEVQFQNALISAAGAGGGGGFFGTLGRLLTPMSFDVGGYTGPGGKHEPAGVVHKGEYVFSKAATTRLGVGYLEALHRRAQGFAAGGFVGGGGGVVGAAAAAPPQVDVHFRVENYGRDPVDMQERRLPDGRKEVVAIIGDALSRGELDKPHARFGARPRVVRR